MKVIHNKTPHGSSTTVSLDKNECLDVVKKSLEMPETKAEAIKIASAYFEKKKEPTMTDVFISNVLYLAQEFGTEAEKKIVHRMIKRLKKKYGSNPSDT